MKICNDFLSCCLSSTNGISFFTIYEFFAGEQFPILTSDFLNWQNQNQKGGYELIRLLLNHIVDKDELHAVNTALRNLAKENFEERELAEGLLWCYEYNPCSKCRQYAVEDLVKRKQIPKAILQECLWDCQKATRELARAALEN